MLVLKLHTDNLGIDWQNLTFGDMIDPVQGFIYPTMKI